METLHIYISVAFLLASYLLTTHFRHKFSKLPPTIFPTLPIIGHLYLLKAPVYRTFAKISAKYGPVVFLHFGSRGVLLVSSPSIAKECFTKNDIIFANRPDLLFGKIFDDNYSGLVFAPYSDNWRNLRRIALTEILSTHRLNEFHDIRSDEGKLMIHKLLSVSVSSGVDMKSVFYEFTLNVMMRMIAGKRYFGGDIPDVEEEGKRFRKILDEAFLLAGSSNLGDYLPILNWFGVKGLEKRLTVLKKKKDKFFQTLIEQVRKRKVDENEKKTTMIEVLLSLQDSDPEYYTDAMITNFVMDLISGGTDTSAGTMEWALSLFLNNPQVLRNAQNEIDRHVGKDRLVDESDLVNLPYLHCIINETLRLYPPGPLLVPHQSSEDCVIGGYNIPRRTILLVNQWAIHHDPKLWTDSERFSPERFIGLEGTRDGFKLMPFGSGRRNCPGEGLALRVLGSTLGLLIQCFEWERISEHMVDMTEAPGLSMPKLKPLVVKCRPRIMMQNLLSQL